MDNLVFGYVLQLLNCCLKRGKYWVTRKIDKTLFSVSKQKRLEVSLLILIRQVDISRSLLATL